MPSRGQRGKPDWARGLPTFGFAILAPRGRRSCGDPARGAREKSPMAVDPPSASFHRSLGQRFRSWFFTGLVLFGPVAVTAYIAWWVVNTIDNWVTPWVPRDLTPDAYLPFRLPGFGVLIALVGLTLLGFLAANIIGRTLVGFSEAMLDRTPLVRGVYKGLKQVFETLFSQSGSQFRKVGLVEFPMKGAWSIVFVSSSAAGALAEALPGGKPMISVFMPCTPNPTTGFYFYIAADDVIDLPISADDAAKLIMSAGLIQPEGQATLAAMAEAAKHQQRLPDSAAAG
jgi:uncharacterized membrane protein